MNKRCVALSENQYRESISLLRTGFVLSGAVVKPNERIATLEVIQACLGLRLGGLPAVADDIVHKGWQQIPP